MNTKEISTQAEYDANKGFDGLLIIKSDQWIIFSGNSTAVLWENSTAELWENSTAELREDSRAKGMDNSSMLIRDNQIVSLYGNATSKKYLQPRYDHDVLPVAGEMEGDKLILFKSVNPDTNCDFKTGRIKYVLGEIVEAPDFDPDINRECGGGLHLSFTAAKTQDFNEGKILKCLVDPMDVVVYHGNIEKVRCRKVLPVAVVDRWGREIK